MKFAICNETFPDWPLARGFEFAAECGYTGVEIAPFTMQPRAEHADVAKISAAERLQVRREAEAAGLEVIGLHWLLAKTSGVHLTSPDAAVRRRTSEYFRELARLCRDLGGSIMVLGSPQQRNLQSGVSYELALQYAAEVLGEALPTFEETGVTLAFEPLAPALTNFITTAEQGVQLIEMLASPHCRLHLDCIAMATEPTPIPELLRRHRAVLAHVHANDPDKQGPGFGELDFHPIFNALGEIDYQGWVSVEVFDFAPGPERLARESIEYMRSVLDDLAE